MEHVSFPPVLFLVFIGGVLPYLVAFLARTSSIDPNIGLMSIGIVVLASGLASTRTGRLVAILGEKKLFLLISFINILVCGILSLAYELLTTVETLKIVLCMCLLCFGSAVAYCAPLLVHSYLRLQE